MAASQLILSRKRSIRSLVSEHLPNAQPSDARPSSPSRPSKRTREPRTPVSPRPQHLRSHDSANYAPTPLLQSFEPVEACAAERQASLKYQSKPASLRTLSSPIKFKGSLESFATNPDCDCMSHSALGDQSKYLYCPPTNPSDGAQQFSCVHDSDSYRRLSYGEPPNYLDSRVFCKSTVPRDLRRKASLHVKDHNCLSFYHQNPEAIQAKPWDSEFSQTKPRLWLGLAEDEEIEEMQATTVSSSPSKPRLILIPGRCVAMKPAQPEPPVGPEWESSAVILDTEPESAIGLGIDHFEGQKHEKQQQAFQRIKARKTWDTKTANPATTVRYTNPLSRPGNPIPPPTLLPPLSESTTQILFDLDIMLNSNASLHLSSPVIQKIRLPSAHMEQRRTPPTIPLSRYSTFKSPPRSIPIQTPTTPPNSASSAAHITTQMSFYPKPNPALRILRTIFPHAATSLLSTLYATNLALHYVHNISLPPQLNYPSEQGTGISYIPSKARAMLGLQMPGPRAPLPSHWVKPHGGGIAWRERIEKVKGGLRRELGRVLRECVGCELGVTVEEVMVRAVGEIIRLVEQREAGK
ncbi:hypothetical protein JMJ35_007465 [Cladonia borealis]|uniref:Uncharacterized protein n=1 Tax=Cladonia borealis TaxID=184061 RepID=A0AA39U876_9LECA|nr:hypothetical protein JMJ35_007465 [Cladonia borealis]